MTAKEKTEGYEAPKIVILGSAEDLTKSVKPGKGSDASSAFHISI